MKIFEKIQYGILLGFCRAVGSLPKSFLYGGFLGFLYFLLYHVTGYRRSVVRDNLKRSFPERSEQERRLIERRFYRHLAEIFIDTISMTVISEEELRKRITYDGLDEHRRRTDGHSWISAMAHYGSWEYAMSYQIYTTQQVVGVYKPLHNAAFERFYKRNRTRFGLEPVAMKRLLKYIVRNCVNQGRPISLGMIADQNPKLDEDRFWFRFLNQPTLFYHGMGKIAVKFGMPVYFMHIEKLGVARYRARFEMIYDGREAIGPNEVLGRYVARLDAMIRRTPELWMWSHRRWKHTPSPEELREYELRNAITR